MTPSRSLSVEPRPLAHSRWSRIAVLALSFAAALVAPGCGTDNVACIFSSQGCQTPGGTVGALGALAEVPATGAWVLNGAPGIVRVLPTGGSGTNGAHSRSPIVIEFTESVQFESTDAAFELVRQDSSGLGGFPTTTSRALVGDGRLLVLLPALPLTAGATYELRLTATAKVLDLTGQQVAQAASPVLTTFKVANTDSTVPKLLASYPADNATDQSEISEIVAIFDQAISASSVNASSWVVKVDGLDPLFDPSPSPLAISGGIFSTSDTRVWRYRSLDGSGDPASLGVDAMVELSLSPAGHTIVTSAGGVLPATVVDFHTTLFALPGDAALLSAPSDAIGLANLTLGDPQELWMDVEFSDAQGGDLLELFLFGASLGENSQTVALARSLTLPGSGPVASTTVTFADFDLLKSSSPIAAQFADGTLSIALRLGRGTKFGPVRRFDADLDLDEIQDLILDTQRPELLELSLPGGGISSQTSDQRGLAVSGRASEFLRAARVVSGSDENGLQPAVVGSQSGWFAAAPVPLGVIGSADLPLAFTITLFDQALNASLPVTANYTQFGAVGPDALGASAPILVTVFDEQTLAPISGARVFAHEDDGSAITQLLDVQTTDVNGRASLSSSLALATVISVDARDIGSTLIDYDLWSFHGVPSARLDVPLKRVTDLTSFSGGLLTTTSSVAQLTLPLVAREFGDTRRRLFSSPTFAGAVCTSSPFTGSTLECSFGPEPIRARQPGVLSMIAGTFTLNELNFSPPSLIQAFELSLPRPPMAANALDDSALVVDALLSEPSLDASLLPLEFPPLALLSFLTTGLDFNDLEDDPSFTGAPRVTVEALCPGLPGSVPVGLGLAFEQNPSEWILRSAYPGEVAVNGVLANLGTIENDLFLRVEVRDNSGNLAGARPRLSGLGSLPLASTLFPSAVPQFSQPLAGSITPGADYPILFGNALVDASGIADGLYRIDLRDASGRSWRHWRLDEPDGPPQLELHQPDLAAAGGETLADGTVVAQVACFAWANFSPGEFLWSDLEREYDLFAQSAAISFTQGP